ncbi:hypothetical protein FQN60_016594, partial [Etheostoma spectabile]
MGVLYLSCVRRAVVTEMLRDKLDLERRALKIVERLLEDSVAEDFLVDCARFITPANYKDALEERSIAKLCGYPICSNELGKIPTQKYRISTKTNKVYDITERKCFCSDFCYKASKEFELQIPNTPLWLRQHESPQEIKLMKKRDGRLQVDDIEDPLAAPPEDPPSSRPGSAADGLSRSESSDVEEEQDFVSSVVSQRQGPRVHWGDLPKHTDEGDRGMMERQKKQGREEGIEGQAAEREGKKGEDKKDSLSCETEVGTDAEKKLNSNTDRPHGEPVPDQQSVEEATAKLNLCSLSESVAQPAPPPVDSTATQAEHTNRITSPLCKDSNSSTERKHLPASTLIKTIQDGHDTASSSQPALNITQVGVSKRGAAGLQDLLKGHAARTKPHSIRLNLLECLRSTLKDWSTDKTLEFLYGAHYSLGCPVVDIKEEKEAGEEDEELDEDDLEDDVTNEDAQWVGAGGQKRASAAVPDYQALRQETQHLELRVRDLRNIVGPLSLTISDFSTDLNNLVKTFRFSNTNIIHKTAEWTLIAVVLLHLLSEVSPVVREALETPASAEYLNTLMEELGLQEQDLLNI